MQAISRPRRRDALARIPKDEYKYELQFVGQASGKVYVRVQRSYEPVYAEVLCRDTAETVEGRIVELSRVKGIRAERVIKRYCLREPDAVNSMNYSRAALTAEPLLRFLEMTTSDSRLQMSLLERKIMEPCANLVGMETVTLREEEIEASDADATTRSAEFAAWAQTQIDEYEQARRGNDELAVKSVEAEALRMAIEQSLALQS